MLKMRKPCEHFVPVPIGPSIPRRDRIEVKERHAKIMLIMFKPWRHTLDLCAPHETWSTAFETFMQNCPFEKKAIMDNMQILHECKDSRDDHFTQRRVRNRDRQNQVSDSVIQTTETTDNNGLTENDNDSILEHLLAIDNCHSASTEKSREDVVSCVTYAEESGLFSSLSTSPHENPNNENLEEVNDDALSYEDIWKAEYDTRRLQWKQQACQSAAQPQARESIYESNIQHETNTLSAATEEIREPQICTPQLATDLEPVIDMEQIIQQFTLNREQARAFRIVAQHSLQNKPHPLRMFLGGAGGTGKSRVINALKEFFDRRHQSRRFRLSSYTGVAARNISGMTLHAALCLNQRNTKGSKDKTHRDLIAMWDGVDYLFVDEVSMLGCKLLLKISEALNDAKQNELPFGGINIIFAGDFAQLPPVGDTRLFARIKTHDVQTTQGNQNIFGKLLWLSVKTIVILTEVMRQQGSVNDEFVALLNRLRDGKCTLDDYSILNSRRLHAGSDGDWSDVPIIVSNNDCKDALNIKAAINFATKTNKALHWYYADDSRGGKMIDDERIHRYLQTMHSGQTNQRLKKIPLVIGMPVMICQNFDVKQGIVNRCTGTLKQIRFRTDTNGHRHATSCIVEAPTSSGSPLSYLEKHCVAVLRDTVDMKFIHPFSHKTCTIKRTQVPLTPAFALTAHKAQGQTMERAIVNLESCRGTESPYVMLSRVKSLEGLQILRPFKIARIQCHQSEDKRREIRRLDFLRLITIMGTGTPSESSEARKLLSTTKYKNQEYTNGNDNDHLSDSVRKLKHLQKANEELTCNPCPNFLLPDLSQNELNNGSGTHDGKPQYQYYFKRNLRFLQPLLLQSL